MQEKRLCNNCGNNYARPISSISTHNLVLIILEIFRDKVNYHFFVQAGISIHNLVLTEMSFVQLQGNIYGVETALMVYA